MRIFFADFASLREINLLRQPLEIYLLKMKTTMVSAVHLNRSPWYFNYSFKKMWYATN